MDKLTLLGKDIEIFPINESKKKMLWPGLTGIFKVYSFSYNGCEMLLFKNNEGTQLSALQHKKMAERIEGMLNLSAVFYFDSLPTYERDRLVGQGVYFVVGNKFAYLPTLFANRRLSNEVERNALLPSAQYILLLHLQSAGLNGYTLKDLEKITPYKYATISKAVQQLRAKGLVETEKVGKSDSVMKFDDNLRNIWEKAQPYLINPIKKVVYLPNEINEGEIGGISALSHYSMLAPENIPTRVFMKFESKAASEYEDVQRIEIWKYPPIYKEEGCVDQLSLFLSLKEDKDPRVEKELETMINKMPW